MDYEQKQIEVARNNLGIAIQEYCRVVLKDEEHFYNERLVAGVQAFLQVNYFKEMYLPVIGVEVQEKR